MTKQLSTGIILLTLSLLLPLTSYALTPKDSDLPFKLNGYFQFKYQFMEDDEEVKYLGRHDGFRFNKIRLNITSPLEESFLSWKISLDGAKKHINEDDSSLGNTYVALADIFLKVKLSELIKIKIGQFKAPFNVEELTDEQHRPMIRDSLLSDGIEFGEGYDFKPAEKGITLDRQIGISLLGNLSLVSYELMLFNGNGINKVANDNNNLGLAGRIDLNLLNKAIILGANGYMRTITVSEAGEIEYISNEEEIAYGADLQLDYMNLILVTQYLIKTTEYPTTKQNTETSTGYMANIGYRIFLSNKLQLIPLFRICSFDPTDISKKEEDDYYSPDLNDELNYYTAGLNLIYDKNLNIKTNFTWRNEHIERTLKNNGLEILLQYMF